MCGPVYSRPSRAGSGNWISLNRFEYLTPGPALAAPTAVPALAKCGRGLLGFALVVLSAFLSTTKPSRGRRGRRGSGSSCASWRTLSCKARGLLTLPHALRYRLAYDQPLCTAVHRALARALRKRLRRLARERRHDGAEAGSVTFVQRYGSGLNLNPHYHAIGLDGWFHRDADDQLTFTRAPTPTQEDVESLLLDVHARALRLLARRGLLEADADDALARDAPALSACYEGAVTQRMGLGPMRGRPVMKLGTSLARHLASAYERVEGAGWLCARLDGFDLHGRVAFGAADRKRLSELVRYCARPPLAYDRLTKQADGRCLLRLKSRWRDGTTHLLFEPIELMERLAAQIPKPRVNLVLYAGVLAPHAKLRADAVVHARPEPLPEPPATETQTRAERDTWSELMRLTFGLDVLQCPRCGGRLKHIATILDGRVARRILEHLGRAARAPPVAPARDPVPFWDAVEAETWH